MSPTSGHKVHDSSFVKCPEYENPWKEKPDWWSPGAGEGAGEGLRLVTGSPFGGDENVLEPDGGDCTPLGVCKMPLSCTV